MLRSFTDLIKEAGSEWMEDNAPRFGAALAFYTMFAVAPLLVICTAIAGLVFGQEAARGEIHRQATDIIGEGGASALQAMVASADHPDAGFWATVFAFIVMAIGSAGLFAELQAALNAIWNVQPRPGRGVLGFLRDRFLSFSMVLGTAFLLLMSLVISTAMAALSKRVGEEWMWAPLLNLAISFAIITVLFAMIYRFLPDAKIAWSDVWLGALVTSVLFNAGKYAIGLYLGHSAISSAYGAAGSLAVLLTWFYYASQVFLFGAEVTQVYAKRHGSGIHPKASAEMVS